MSDPTLDEVEQNRMPLLEHLRELRYRLIICGAAIAVGMVVSLIAVEPMFAVLTAPLRLIIPGAGGEHPQIDAWYRMAIGPLSGMVETTEMKGTLAITSSPLEGIYTYFRVALMGGLSMSVPVISWQLWGFIAPGLYQTERRMVYPLVFFSTLLFALGASFAYLVILPLAFPFFFTVLEAEPIIGVSGYLSTVVRFLVVFGACFQLPVIVWFMARLGLIDHRDMISGFRYSMVGIFVIAAIITPPEVLTQLALAVPLIILYCVGIVVAFFTSTKERMPEPE